MLDQRSSYVFTPAVPEVMARTWPSDVCDGDVQGGSPCFPVCNLVQLVRIGLQRAISFFLSEEPVDDLDQFFWIVEVLPPNVLACRPEACV
jgi:hypothetical protein